MTPEQSLQRLVLDWLAAKNILAFRMNTGAVKTEKRFFRFGVSGMADIVAFPIKCYADGVTETWKLPLPVWIELKSAKGRQTPEQKSFQKQVEEVGHVYLVARNLDEVITAMEGT